MRENTQVRRYGTGRLELTVKSEADLEVAKKNIKTAYRCVGG